MTNAAIEAARGELATKTSELKMLKLDFYQKMKNEFTNVTKFFFEATGIQAIIWNQYTPGFNDGEPCVHSIEDAVFVRQNFDPEDLMSASNYEDDHYDPVTYSTYRLSGDPLSDFCREFNEFLESNEHLLEQLFQTNTTVYVTKDATYTNEYDCGW